ncbi:MAG: Arc family DNA-binding protein [Acinetobacter sp.]
MSNQADHTIVRLRVPPELKQKIEESAEKNNRSQSAEMVARLDESFTTQYKESDLNMIAAGFCMGLYQRYKGQLEDLNKELVTEKDEKRILLLKAEIQRMEILASETKSLTKNMSNKG